MHLMAESELQMELVVSAESTLQVWARCRYSASRPYQVEMVFHDGTNDLVRWVFARDLLIDGARRPTGDGDVRVWPDRDEDGHLVCCLSLNSPSGSSVLTVRAQVLGAWNERMCRIVPPGMESHHLDLDAGLAALL